jgi:hypothetical protein
VVASKKIMDFLDKNMVVFLNIRQICKKIARIQMLKNYVKSILED